MRAIIQISEWPAAAIEELLAESEQEGFRFVRRAQDEWLSGANRFANEGEALFGVFEGERLVAISGINRGSGCCGRLRRFYVRRDGRRKGIGRQLVQHVLAFARRHYSRVELRCDTEAADRFYRALGLSRTTAAADVTHAMELAQMNADKTTNRSVWFFLQEVTEEMERFFRGWRE
jgi:GNAT superfamily N-acetyltransferase